MTYKFICPECKTEHSVDMKISEYTSEGHNCEKCGHELERSVTDFAGGAIWKCPGAYGVGNH